MSSTQPNILVVMTDEERYPPPYERETLAEFRRTHLPARERLRTRSLELHRHYAASTACLPSRASLFTGQYPSLHGVRSTDGLAKPANDPAMTWLDPDSVPTMGDWFRAAGYETQYRGKWHISHPDLLIPGTHEALLTNDRDANVITEHVDAYRRADRLDPFGYGGWVGCEPHGAHPANTGFVRDGIFADQVCEMLAGLAARASDGPWLAVASFVNPHDIAFSAGGWQAFGFPEPDERVPDVPEAPSQSDSLDERPNAQREFRAVWPKMLYPQPTDGAYRRFYHWLHLLVDVAIGRILDALDASGMRDDTLVVFTSDHGDQLGAHGGLQQKWYNAYDESIRVPMMFSGPGIAPREGGISMPTSHVDVLPTLLGLAGVDREQAARQVSEHHIETHPLPGRDLREVLTGTVEPDSLDAPCYFMTEDQMTNGSRRRSQVTGTEFEPVREPANIESVIAHLRTGRGASVELWKLNRYYAVLDGDGDAPEQWETYNLTADPEERRDRSRDESATFEELGELLVRERTAKRRTPARTNS